MEFVEERFDKRNIARFGKCGRWERGTNDCNAVYLSALLRVRATHGGNGQYTEEKISSPHWITSSATNVQVWLKE
jgi:hypothetical protein